MLRDTQHPLILQEPVSTANGYLLTASKSYTLCNNEEGWGPTSPYRWDFTPCFIDVWVSLVAAFGIVLGAGAIWYLLKTSPPQPVKKNWHFYAKLVSCPVLK
jgi:hypothetical protein